MPRTKTNAAWLKQQEDVSHAIVRYATSGSEDHKHRLKRRLKKIRGLFEKNSQEYTNFYYASVNTAYYEHSPEHADTLHYTIIDMIDAVCLEPEPMPVWEQAPLTPVAEIASPSLPVTPQSMEISVVSPVLLQSAPSPTLNTSSSSDLAIEAGERSLTPSDETYQGRSPDAKRLHGKVIAYIKTGSEEKKAELERFLSLPREDYGFLAERSIHGYSHLQDVLHLSYDIWKGSYRTADQIAEFAAERLIDLWEKHLPETTLRSLLLEGKNDKEYTLLLDVMKSGNSTLAGMILDLYGRHCTCQEIYTIFHTKTKDHHENVLHAALKGGEATVALLATALTQWFGKEEARHSLSQLADHQAKEVPLYRDSWVLREMVEQGNSSRRGIS